jgi:hypothetical protein
VLRSAHPVFAFVRIATRLPPLLDVRPHRRTRPRGRRRHHHAPLPRMPRLGKRAHAPVRPPPAPTLASLARTPPSSPALLRLEGKPLARAYLTSPSSHACSFTRCHPPLELPLPNLHLLLLPAPPELTNGSARPHSISLCHLLPCQRRSFTGARAPVAAAAGLHRASSPTALRPD